MSVMDEHAANGDGWDGILDPDERILWQGQPDASIVLRRAHLATFPFGLAFSGFALFWMIMASFAGGYFWMFGLLHFGVGIAIALGPIFLTPWIRRRTWYTLTNRRAFIATNTPMGGRRLTSYPIGPDTTLDFRDDGLPSLYFAHRVRTGKKGRRHRDDIGFERIEDGREVYRMMREMQKGEA